jgi:DNA polymerase-4
MRKIIHIDMDCFFAAVEMRDFPELRGQPVAVGGSSQRRGVISTCNYEARKFGVRSAMPTARAFKLCPNLILQKSRFSTYAEASDQVFKIFHDYTPLVQSMSLDEAYLDVTDADLPSGSATLLAKIIRERIYKETGLTASAGIAENKLLAKLASEVKKPNGQFTIDPSMVAQFMLHLPLGKIHGVGKVTSDYLASLGFKTCSDLLPFSRFEMNAKFGKLGEYLFFAIRGISFSPVITEWERKSLGSERTFSEDLTDPTLLQMKLHELTLDVQESLTNYSDKKLASLQVKIKYHDFQLTTIERTGLGVSVENTWTLFLDRWSQDPRPVRLLGVSVKFSGSSESSQLTFDALSLSE